MKQHMIQVLSKKIPGLAFNGDHSKEGSLYTVLNISIPPYDGVSTLLYQLDIEGVCVSGGSACNSGALGGSHVLEGIGHDGKRAAVRFSFSRFNKQEELDYAIDKLMKIIKVAEPA